jgi:hypothetical protein
VKPSDSFIAVVATIWKKLILHRNAPDAAVADFIRTECATCMGGGPEEGIIQEVLAESRVLRFTKQLPFLPCSSRLPVITTN